MEGQVRTVKASKQLRITHSLKRADGGMNEGSERNKARGRYLLPEEHKETSQNSNK